MASKAIGLTDAKIRGLKVTSGQAEYPDALVPGLRVRVGVSGAKTFILRKRVGGRLRNLTVGRYHEARFTLADARKKARTLLNDIEAGGDPSAKLRMRRQGIQAGTIRALYEDYRRAREGELRTFAEVERIFERYILPTMADRLADSITRADVTHLVDGIAAKAMARAVAAQLSAFYTWALPGLDARRMPFNPCLGARKPAKPESRTRKLSIDELRALWKAVAAEPWPWGPGIRLLILTLQRRNEVFGADRAEFDQAERIWTIPGARAKNGEEHIVPLSEAAFREFEALPSFEGSAKLFPARSNPENGASGFSKAWARIRTAVEVELGRPVERFTIHDLRRTGATGMQRLGIRLEVTEAVLNHVSGSKAGIVGVYQQHHFTEEKRAALDAWAAEVGRMVSGEGRGNVVALRG